MGSLRLSRPLAVALPLAALAACSSGSSKPSDQVGAQPSPPAIIALVEDCSQTVQVAGGTSPGTRRVATILPTNDTDSPATFHLVINGVNTAANDPGGSAEMTLQPEGQTHDHKMTTYLMPDTGATIQDCMNLDIEAVTGS